MFKKYYLNKDKKFGLYGYSPPGNGKWRLDDQEFDVGEDFRTVERYKEYKEVGFNILLMQTTGTYYGEDWETSAAKKVMDNAYAAGIEKIIVLDGRLYWLTRAKDGLFGDGKFDDRVYDHAPIEGILEKGKKFDNQENLDKYVKECMAPYITHPAFYGVQFCDEPHYYLFKSIGQVYRSIKKVNKDIFIQCNLLPLDTLRWMDERYPQGGDLFSRQDAYLEMYLDETGADCIMYDDYPFCFDKEKKINYLRCLQNVANVCKKRNVKMHFVAQSTSMDIGKNHYYYTPSEKEFRYQMNLLLGFGIKEFGFFTYWTKADNKTDGEMYPEEAAMISRKGKKTEMYFTVQKILKEMEAIIPLISNFEYKHSTYDVCTFESFLKQFDYALNEKLDNILFFETDREAVLINELYNENNCEYLYRVINSTDTRLEKLENVAQNTVILFDKKYKTANVFYDGRWEIHELQDGKIELSLFPGESAYILI